MKRLHRGFVRGTSKNLVERQTPFSVSPVTAFVVIATAIAVIGVAQQTGLIEGVLNIISKLFIVCCEV